MLERNPWWRRCFHFEPHVAREAAAAAAHAVAVLDPVGGGGINWKSSTYASAPFPRQRGVSRW
ncbi:unnamed protein product [Ectocarpus sp. CCAP 1310/34]|nr:unnamed protein product [Ectocarpus sp. CCAP 1310/34]